MDGLTNEKVSGMCMGKRYQILYANSSIAKSDQGLHKWSIYSNDSYANSEGRD